jgi:signal transduction histidine kinase
MPMQIRLKLKKKDGNLSLVISDDGIGFNSKIKKEGYRDSKYALSNKKECHGEFNIKSKRRRYNYYHYHSNRTKN